MNEALKRETERLERSWMEQEAGKLRDYLVAGVEDPRVNLQSIFTRHFLARALTGDRHHPLMAEEYRFSALMNWLLGLSGRWVDPEEPAGILHALRQGADNCEGVPIPFFARRAFAALSRNWEEGRVPNYVELFLSGVSFVNGRAVPSQASLNVMVERWKRILDGEQVETPLTVVELACGSANDYRFLEACGMARHLDYTGVDLCAKNIANALSLFPRARFQVGNAFDIPAADAAFDLCFVQDLFEHLSGGGIERTMRELCRVTRKGICIGFFNMDEIEEHDIRPVYDYHWNTLSMARMRERFEAMGFAARVLHVGSFLRQQTGCEQTHNANAYTFVMMRAEGGR